MERVQAVKAECSFRSGQCCWEPSSPKQLDTSVERLDRVAIAEVDCNCMYTRYIEYHEIGGSRKGTRTRSAGMA